ncbi:MAG: aspartate carbamoyltransferase catalytic subunit [Alphaproteobacteria bacterium]|nr:aspartate carbamoyltransferase catalytic subunit [Alphaproteobacteria bacterium]MCL2505091.1 aspartate carbamoyltransferase catalytic subunit [Alphaproteobacteria bacterium]
MPIQNIFKTKDLLDVFDLSPSGITELIELANNFSVQNRQSEKKIYNHCGKTVVNFFMESSTRTRTSFEIAAKRLGMDVVNIPVAQSSVSKGETMLDTAATLDAMLIDALVIRCTEEALPSTIAGNMKAHVISAGAGISFHPTQALLDAMTIFQRKGTLSGLKVAICGDVARSRVARSNIRLLQKFGTDISIVAPDYFISQDYYEEIGVKIYNDLKEGIREADVIITLRVQNERTLIRSDKADAFDFGQKLNSYVLEYRLNHENIKAAKEDVIVLHPGPVNRDVEISSSLIDDEKYSMILKQVENGVAMRMAVLHALLGMEN